jgi:hypothetical protein
MGRPSRPLPVGGDDDLSSRSGKGSGVTWAVARKLASYPRTAFFCAAPTRRTFIPFAFAIPLIEPADPQPTNPIAKARTVAIFSSPRPPYAPLPPTCRWADTSFNPSRAYHLRFFDRPKFWRMGTLSPRCPPPSRFFLEGSARASPRAPPRGGRRRARKKIRRRILRTDKMPQ